MSSTLHPVGTDRNSLHNTIDGDIRRRDQKELVQFSVRAQDYILKQGLKDYSMTVDGGEADLPLGVGNNYAGRGMMNNYLEDGVSARENKFQLPKIRSKN